MTAALLYSAEFLAVATLAVLLVRRGVRSWWCWFVGGFGLLAFVVTLALHEPAGQDVRSFWEAGTAVWRGEDPYADPHLLNPPVVLPLYAVMALLPFATLLAAWTVFNATATVLLVWLGQRALSAQGDDSSWRLPPATLVVLTAAVILSFSSRYGLALGQLAVLTTLFLFAALDARGRGRPILAGVWLALAAIKTATMLPFLLLFHRKADRLSWVAMMVAGVGLTLLTTSPRDLPTRCRECLRNIERFGAAGGYNDYAYSNASSAEILAIDHALYRVGLRDRTALRWGQLVVLGLVGVWLARRVLTSERDKPAAATALVALFAALFLYHRVYDLVVLVLPLLYATGRSVRIQGTARILYGACVAAVLGALYLRVGMLRELSAAVPESPGLGWRFIEVVVLPYGDWCLLVGLCCLAAAEKRTSRDRQEARAPALPDGRGS